MLRLVSHLSCVSHQPPVFFSLIPFLVFTFVDAPLPVTPFVEHMRPPHPSHVSPAFSCIYLHRLWDARPEILWIKIQIKYCYGAGIDHIKLHDFRSNWAQNMWFTPLANSCPDNFSKTIVANVKGNGEKTQGVGENSCWGLPYAHDRVLPSQSTPMAHPFLEWHPWLDWVVSLADSGAWGVAIVGNFSFSPSPGTPRLPHDTPPHQIVLGGCRSMGTTFFLPIMQLPGIPSHTLFSVGCSSMENIVPAVSQSRSLS